MSYNPLYSSNDSPTNQTTPSKAVNRQAVYVPRTHNTFDMSYFNFTTQRFGQYQPFFVMEGVPGDKLPFSSSHNVRSLPFASPFLSSLKLNKDYFLVPNQAIQPHSWELIFKNPSQGDDVPDSAYNVFDLYLDQNNGIFSILTSIQSAIQDDVVDEKTIWSMLNAELFFSTGSLLYNLGFKLNPIFIVNGSPRSFDYVFDAFFRNLYLSISVTVEGVTYFFQNQYSDSDGYVSTSVILDLLRFFGSSAKIVNFTYFNDVLIESIRNLPPFGSKSSRFNCDRLCAYQLSAAQYYINPQVDFLYNAALYRDNFLAAVNNLDPEVREIGTFTVNGIRVLFDAFSNHQYFRILNYIRNYYDNNADINANVYDVLSLLLGYKETLKFGDYFTDSRTRPLAVGDTNIQVQADNTVSVIDTSRKIVLQRFLNNVIKLGNNFGDYLRGIYGTTPSPDYHFPKFIIHQDFDISGFETANTTSTDQGLVTSQLMSGDDTYVFEIDIDMPCVLIGISHFSLPLVYSQTKDRQFFHSDRFDFFNPMMQYTGDQQVFLAEKSDVQDPNTDVTGYQSRYNEYKQRFSVASGGFIEKLPAWSFVLDDLFNSYRDLGISNVQSPVAIRHMPYQFDRFFKAISGFSQASAFHFIVVYNNKCVCNRPMEVNPNIL